MGAIAIAIGSGAVIGLSLGALGGGGSILTVPALVYLLHQPAHAATSGSLIIVGLTALVGAGAHWRAGRVRVGAGLAFALLGVAGSFAGSRASAAVNPHVLLLGFAALMLAAAVAMARRSARNARATASVPTAASPTVPPDPDTPRTRWTTRTTLRVLLAASAVGLLTGFFGVGGGFVIVPALVLALGFGMAEAVGTSLLVIAFNSAVALGARAQGLQLDWAVLGVFTAAAAIASLAGKRVADVVSGQALNRAFVALLVLVAAYVGVQSVLAL